MPFDFQPTTLANDIVKLIPLKEDEFEILYNIAKDPLIWEQHPNKDRYKRDVFETFFEGAVKSKGAFIIYDSKTNQPIGSSRFYDYDEADSNIAIGYTFYARDHWGSTYNQAGKKLMLDHAFKYVEKVHFHIGAENIRSQMAITKLGAKKVAEKVMEYYGESPKLNFIFQIEKKDWKSNI